MEYAVLFDMDGTLVDSEPYWQSSEEVIVQRHGKTWTQAEGDQQTGNPLEQTAANVIKLKDLPYTVPQMIDLLLEQMAEHYQKYGVPWMTGVPDMLKSLQSAGIKTAIVSASFENLVQAVAQQAPAGSITTIVSGNTPNAGQKPSGSPYLTAAKQLGVPVENCIVVEDSLTGIQAGQDAQMPTVMVGNMDLVTKAAQQGLGADYGRYLLKQVIRLKSAGELTPELVKELISGRDSSGNKPADLQIGQETETKNKISSNARMQERLRGPFRIGEKVQLSDPAGRLFTVTITEKGWFNVHKGSFPMSKLIGKPEGTVVTSREGRQYLAVRPRRLDYTLSMPRGAAIIYPKDAGQIIQNADIFTGARVFECGVGSGALSLNLLNTIGPNGYLLSLEAREEFADIAQANVDIWFSGTHPAWNLCRGRLGEINPKTLAVQGTVWAGQELSAEEYQAALVEAKIGFDRIVLDLLDPWSYLVDLRQMLRPGGVLCCYVTTIPQVSTLVEALRDTKQWSACETWETMQRSWHVEGLAVRPDHRMVAHTGFLVTTRLLAPNCRPPERLPNQVKSAQVEGSQWSQDEPWSEVTLGQRNQAPKKLRKVRNDAVAKANYWVRSGRVLVSSEENMDTCPPPPSEANVSVQEPS